MHLMTHPNHIYLRNSLIEDRVYSSQNQSFAQAKTGTQDLSHTPQDTQPLKQAYIYATQLCHILATSIFQSTIRKSSKIFFQRNHHHNAVVQRERRSWKHKEEAGNS